MRNRGSGDSVEGAIAQRDKLLCHTGKKRNNQSKKAMIQEYLNKAMETAHYELLAESITLTGLEK
ncbi:MULTISPECIES: hypothetical protein [Microcystis]|uniref:Uncharacterized protein n=1 Tax=Microcystis panniformis FACHB-1757 TaxID=1638788 RepID=A0A0K1S6U8_9CHRO|nr:MULTISPECIES: hypothetical protein [Microcystis]AKV69872.1 hypothetical protein VL20_4997 [Microcystis panniformis FACHB-1757]TRT81031.1 MAG: hypothetical protein EWV83_00765 [Microcystis sp. M_OC_Ca_00000000_S217Cul]TRT90811.1 MAG: hypothetical protein EWV66_07790 [Microcystis sp. M_OC_Ca_00000000_C217Col]